MVGLEKVTEDDDIEELRGLISKHVQYTNSATALKVLAHWDAMLPKFVKVMLHLRKMRRMWLALAAGRKISNPKLFFLRSMGRVCILFLLTNIRPFA